MRTHKMKSPLGLAGMCVIVSLGCSGDTTNPVSLPPTQTFWTLQFTQHAVNLALTASDGQPVEDTLHLVATGRNLVGQPLAGGTIQYHSTDSTVTIDSTGLMTARYVTSASGTAIIASQTVRGTTLTDTAFVQVTQVPLPAPLTTLVLQPVNTNTGEVADSARVAVDKAFIVGLMPFATIATGSPATDTVCNVNGCPLLVRIWSSDSSVAFYNIRVGYIIAERPGHVTFYVDTWAYGVAKRDSLPFVFGYPIGGVFVGVVDNPVSGRTTSVLGFAPDSITIGVTGIVQFYSLTSTPIDIVFDSTQQNHYQLFRYTNNAVNRYTIFPLVDSADHRETQQDNSDVSFNAVGTYAYHSHLFGTGGKIVVSAGP